MQSAPRRRRPNESYSTIIIKAIRNSPLQRLKLSEIYDYVHREIPTMDGNDKGWQNTVRHNLSHNKCFRRIVIKDEDLPSGSAEDDDGESKQSTSTSTGKSSKQAKRGKGGCWVLVPENLEESISSSRPKKSSMDQGQSPAAPGAGTGPLSSTGAKKQHSSAKSSTAGATSTTGKSYLSSQMSKEYALSHPHSSMMDIDRNVASMMIAEQQLQQSGRHHGPHMHSSHYNPPHPHSRQQHASFTHSHSQPHHYQQQHHHHPGSYPFLLPHYTSSSSTPSTSSSKAIMNTSTSSATAFQPGAPTSRPGQHSYSGSGDSESDDGHSRHSVLSTDREIEDEDEEGDGVMDDDFGSYSSSSRHSPSHSPSDSSFSATSSPMEIERPEGSNDRTSSSSSPTTGRRSGMSIQNMLN
ncbi:hypothetical protein EC991_000395 [Linnemannia zychae]|nr:hypothetical protein EC991_000395 [Linnemannia zychae]